MLEAITHAAQVGTGDTRPQVFWCSDAEGTSARWVLKLMGLANVELAADWIGTVLAHRLGIPCPEVEVANVSTAALATAPADVRAWAKPGPAFASRELIRSTTVQSDTDLLDFASDELLGRMFAIDCWLEVLDRRKPDGNWNALITTDDANLVVIDYGKGLSRALLPWLGDAGGHGPEYPTRVRRQASLEAETALCDIIETMSRDELHEIVLSVPPAWISEPAQSKILEFLEARARLVRSLCETMHNEGA